MYYLRSLFKIESIRTKLLFTLSILFVYRFGCAIPVPFVSGEVLDALFSSGNIFAYFNTLSGGALSQCSIFALGVAPYINASIVVQLLTYAIPQLEQLSKGALGRKKLEKITKAVSLFLAFGMGFGYYAIINNYGAVQEFDGAQGVFAAAVIVLSFVAGSQFVSWLGGLIDEVGIGSGASLIIISGILARWSTVNALVSAAVEQFTAGNRWYIFIVAAVVAAILGSLAYVVYLNGSERRVPISYASARGKRVPSGKSYIPLKLMMSGVMPIIFANVVISVPPTIAAFINSENHPTLYKVLTSFGSSSSPVYWICFLVLLFAFNYFYIAIQYDATAMANNLRENGGAIPGVRPGKPTSDCLNSAMNQIALVGSIWLAIVACLPTIVSRIAGVSVSFGGSSLIIVVGVAIEVVTRLDSFVEVRHHQGFLGSTTHDSRRGLAGNCKPG